MATREEIREGIARFLFSMMHPTENWEKATETVRFCYFKRADEQRKLLHSQGVVIKVERESDRCELCECGRYLAVEPLIND